MKNQEKRRKNKTFKGAQIHFPLRNAQDLGAMYVQRRSRSDHDVRHLLH